MLDDKDIQKLATVLVTKKDLEGMVANNLKIFATKKDLEDMAANNLKVFATKKDLENMADNNLKIFATKQDVKEIREDIATSRELLQGLLVVSDKMLKSMEILSAEYKAVSVQLTRHEKWIRQLSEKVGVQLAFE